ncbi:hypothetical protein [Jannaschia seohaensis]|uniref:Esterase/lipase superfamily enzyme n=1 Tax=Jannaschia seohaensis TaxID=475081 RepID=A0A2Y9AYF1_9RHOB|nr:hypothetical protein [Jannaschia seohaensis]PWJ17502.1 hypothetical protein BCF38_106112 [Jannaschia seohaensis]SSA47617.1 hypothetical protein SAMN05421539_106112 [Jannaschia seohaensis]
MGSRVETLLRDEELTLRWLPGRAPRLVVAFTGMRAGFGGTPLDEFAGSAGQGGENNVLFVTDRRATWYSATGLWARILGAVRHLVRERRVQETISLGTSMGGYGAMLLPRHVRVKRAIAFAPQVTLDRAVLDDDRWPRIARPVLRDLAATLPDTGAHYYLTAGAGCAADVAHLDLLPEHKRVHRYVLPTGRHNVAGALKEAGLLGQVISAIIRGRKTRLERLYETFAQVAA